MQKKAIVIRKCKSHRIGITVFAILMFVILAVIILPLHSAAALLLYIPPLIILVPLTLYYLTWNMRFEEKVIVKCIFFAEISRCSYSILREVVKRYYTSERNFTIRMYFVDKKNKAIGAVHAGWRGTYEKIAQKTIEEMSKKYNAKIITDDSDYLLSDLSDESDIYFLS